MTTFLRKLRQQANNKVSNYLFYAIGEIILVVIGILIALQINNINDQKKERTNELKYLANLKKDLEFNILEIDKYIVERTKAIDAAKIILDSFEGRPIINPVAFLELGLPIYNWQRFYQNNNTFQELTSSGNLALITDDSVKTLLYGIESVYKVNKAEEDHFRFDTEVLIYEPLYSTIDLKPGLENMGLEMSKLKGKSYSVHTFDLFLKSNKLKNGFTMTILEFTVMNEQLNKMKKLSQLLIRSIDRELEKG